MSKVKRKVLGEFIEGNTSEEILAGVPASDRALAEKVMETVAHSQGEIMQGLDEDGWKTAQDLSDTNDLTVVQAVLDHLHLAGVVQRCPATQVGYPDDIWHQCQFAWKLANGGG